MSKDTGFRIRIERDLRRAFVDACHNEGKSASDVIREYIASYVNYDAQKRQPDLFLANINDEKTTRN